MNNNSSQWLQSMCIMGVVLSPRGGSDTLNGSLAAKCRLTQSPHTCTRHTDLRRNTFRELEWHIKSKGPFHSTMSKLIQKLRNPYVRHFHNGIPSVDTTYFIRVGLYGRVLKRYLWTVAEPEIYLWGPGA